MGFRLAHQSKGGALGWPGGNAFKGFAGDTRGTRWASTAAAAAAAAAVVSVDDTGASAAPVKACGDNASEVLLGCQGKVTPAWRPCDEPGVPGGRCRGPACPLPPLILMPPLLLRLFLRLRQLGGKFKLQFDGRGGIWHGSAESIDNRADVLASKSAINAGFCCSCAESKLCRSRSITICNFVVEQTSQEIF